MVIDQVRTLVRYRPLIRSLVSRDLKARYRGSLLGFFWSFINPLLLLITYGLVFTYVLPARHSPAMEPYLLFFACGILPWTWFQSSLAVASGVLIAGGNLIKKVLFPAEVLPVVTVFANLAQMLLALPILALFLLYQGRLSAGALWVVLPILVQLVFTLGFALLLSALTVHFRDIRDLLANLLQLWFFATPIIYYWRQENVLRFKPLFDLNPFTHLAISYQEILFFPGPFGHWKWLVALLAMSCGMFLFGYFLFDRLRDSFAEEV